MKDVFGNRMKMYEKVAQQQFIPLLPICIRLDGRSFSKWTKNLKRPFDGGMLSLMRDLTISLVEETNALIGYTQSDEISLILYSDNINSQTYFNGKIQKIVSSLSAHASAWFNFNAEQYLDVIISENNLATFDCRAWQVPNKVEAVNVLLWREQDATKNSISTAASSVYSHKQLQGKSGAEKQDMLMDKGINWNDYPRQFKRGTFVQRKKSYREFTKTEIELLPEQHTARVDPSMKICRTSVKVLIIPPFSKVVNRTDVVFLGEQPEKQGVNK